ncbi:hypothetical protein Tco_0576256 [Tanacetum coccineum]
MLDAPYRIVGIQRIGLFSLEFTIGSNQLRLISFNHNNYQYLTDGQLVHTAYRLQGRFLGLQVNITWATRFLKFSCKEANQFSFVYRKSFLLSQGSWSFGFELQRGQGFSVRILLSSGNLSTSLLLGFQVSGYRQVKVLEFFDCSGPRQGVEDLRDLLHRVELQGAQGDREAEVFQVSNDDTTVAQRRLEDKQPEEKTNTDCLVKEQEKGYNHVYISRMLEPVKVKCIFMGYHDGIVGNKLWRLDDVTSNAVLYRNMGFNESGEYKKTFIGSGVARDREQHSTHELFSYREDSNEAAFADAEAEKIYAHESLTFNDTVAYEVISKWKAELKEDMDIRSDVSSGIIVRIHNEKLVQTLLKGHSTLSLKDSLSRDCDVEKNGYELRLVAGIATDALVKGYSRSEVPALVKVVAYRNWLIVILRYHAAASVDNGPPED